MLIGSFPMVAAGCVTRTASSTASASAIPAATVRQGETASAGPAATATHSLDPNYSGFEMIAFGTGGPECTLVKKARTFTPDDPIRVTAQYAPSLVAGTVVTIRRLRDGREV